MVIKKKRETRHRAAKRGARLLLSVGLGILMAFGPAAEGMAVYAVENVSGNDIDQKDGDLLDGDSAAAGDSDPVDGDSGLSNKETDSSDKETDFSDKEAGSPDEEADSSDKEAGSPDEEADSSDEEDGFSDEDDDLSDEEKEDALSDEDADPKADGAGGDKTPAENEIMLLSEDADGFVCELEAEEADLTNGASVKESGNASGGKLVENIGTDGGSHGNGMVTFHVTVEKAGSYAMGIYYATESSDRYFDISVNGEAVTASKAFPSTGDFSTPCAEPAVVNVALQEGENTISFGCENWYAPNLDKIEIRAGAKEDDPEDGDEEAKDGYYEAEEGTLGGQARLSGCADASRGQMVGYLGGENDNRGTVTIENVAVEEAGIYAVDIYYATGDMRSFTITVNGSDVTRMTCVSSGGYEVIGMVTVELRLEAGNNSITFGSDGWAPNLDRIYVPEEPEAAQAAQDGRLTLQAEDATLKGEAFADQNSSACSGGGKVSNIGQNGEVRFENIVLEETGTYAIDVAYCTKSDRSFLITVDDGTEIWMECLAGYEWDVPNRHIVTCELEAGAHSITFRNPEGYAPNLDEISIYPCGGYEMGEYTFVYDLQTGNYNLIAQGRTRLSDAAAVVTVDGKMYNSANYAEHEWTSEPIQDDFGTGQKVSCISKKDGCPVIEQSFSLYEGLSYLLTRTTVYWEDGRTIGTNYIAPLYLTGTGSAENEMDGNDCFLRVPYDNDGWVSYELNGINGSDTGYEAAAVLNEENGKALVMGSLTHDTWKTGITYSGNRNQLYALQVYGGANSSLTRDQSPHGTVTGEKVSSPLVFIGFYDDWKEGMEEYARANTIVVAPKTDGGSVPIGWNSWGSVQTALNLETANGISDYIYENFQDAWTTDDSDVVYTVLDSYWDNLTDEELKNFVEHCKANGQKPGIYWGPFVSWKGQTDLRTEIVEGTEDVIYQDIILKKADGSYYGNDLDGAFPVDMTHPAAQARVDYFIDKFKEAGFEYIKLDFLVHGALEGQRYDPSIETGIQAYNFGMQYVMDRIDGQMFINLSIAPTFPYQYANGKRIACDAYYGIGETEYTLNGLTYGFWQKELYQYPDPDHLVVWGNHNGSASLEEARSRVTSGVLLGTSFLTGDNFVNPIGDKAEADARFQAVLTNPDIIAVAKTGKIFKPVQVAKGLTASNLFVMTDGEVSYLAALNYGDSAYENQINLKDLFDMGADDVVKELWSGEEQMLQDGVLSVVLAGRDAKIYRIGAVQEPDPDEDGTDDGGSSGDSGSTDGNQSGDGGSSTGNQNGGSGTTGGNQNGESGTTGGNQSGESGTTGGNQNGEAGTTGGNQSGAGGTAAGNQNGEAGASAGIQSGQAGISDGNGSGGSIASGEAEVSGVGETGILSPETGDDLTLLWIFLGSFLLAGAVCGGCIYRKLR